MLILDFIKKFIAQNGYSPTIREIQNGLAIKSPSTVHDHLRKLADCQILAYIPSKSRTIELLVENEYLKDEVVHIQFIDKIQPTLSIFGLTAISANRCTGT